MFKDKVISAIEAHTNLDRAQIDKLLEIPPDIKMGNYAFPCFILTKELKKKPNEMAEELKQKIELSKELEDIKVEGPYINFFVNKEMFTEYAMKDIPHIESNNIPKSMSIALCFALETCASPIAILSITPVLRRSCVNKSMEI